MQHLTQSSFLARAKLAFDDGEVFHSDRELRRESWTAHLVVPGQVVVQRQPHLAVVGGKMFATVFDNDNGLRVTHQRVLIRLRNG